MHIKVPDHVGKILACPHCRSTLHSSIEGAACGSCQILYEYTNTGALDLRLHKPKVYQCDFTLGMPLLRESDFTFVQLPINCNPEVDFLNSAVPHHLSKEILSYFPKAKTANSLMLDLGCGDMVHQEVCEQAGFEHIGMDFEAKEASVLGDAHALPFKDGSFEFILSIAVLEHLRFPFIAMKEAYRVLKPEGIFIGTVAFLEPFHGDSFYHHTHLGVYNSLQIGGFRIEKVCPSSKWSVLMAQASMGLFPKMPRLLSKLLVMPVQILHRIWWRIGSVVSNRASEEVRVRNTTGAFTFIARK